MAVIRWNGDNVKVVPTVRDKGDISDEVAKKIGSPKSDHIQLSPGVNMVSDVDWTYAKSHVKDALKKGDEKGGIVEVTKVVEKEVTTEVEVEKNGKKVMQKQKSTETVKKPVSSLTELSIKEAEKAAKDIFNGKTLVSWLKKEPRDSVRLAIKKQLEDLGMDDKGIVVRRAKKEKPSDNKDDDIEDDTDGSDE